MIEVRQGDLAVEETEAVLRPVGADWAPVTPAMRRLDAAAGAGLREHCLRLGELPPGSAVITPAGDLPCRFLVHVVVRSPEEPVTASTVSRGLLNGLRRVAEWGLASVALPLLGTGAGNLDAEEAAEAMAPVLLEAQAAAGDGLRVLVVAETEYERDAMERCLRRVRETPPAVRSRQG